MNLSKNTVLITGGASGIGLALASRFLSKGSTVIICGRRVDKLAEAQRQYPGLHAHVADVATVADREALATWVVSEFPRLNVLINNAGVQNRLRVTDLATDWETRSQEIAINLEAPIHLAALLLPHLGQQSGATIINVTSGLAFGPIASLPLYCATKAALHSFTRSLREQLVTTGVQVLEVIPPAVDTDLGAPGLHTFGVPVDEFTDAVMTRLAAGDVEVRYGSSARAHSTS